MRDTKMTRKDFQLIADALAAATPSNTPEDSFHSAWGLADGWARSVNKVAAALQDSNPRYDRGKFVDACLAKEHRLHCQLKVRSDGGYVQIYPVDAPIEC
jgi:hypothetical protein